MRILFVIFLFTVWVFGSNIIIEDNDISYENFEINFYQDKSKKLSLEDIQNIKEFQKVNNNIALGKQEGNIWLHFSIKNSTQKIQKRVLFMTEPNLWDIELFIIADKKIISTQIVGQNILSKDGKIASFYPELEINLEAGESIDIYIRSFSPFNHTFKVVVPTNKDLIKYKILKNSLLSLYFGAIGALLLYNLFIYFSIRDKNYLLYIGFVFFYLLAQVQLTTPFNSLFTSMQTTFAIASVHIFWIAFHTLFSVKLLNIKEYYPRLGQYLLYTGYFLLALSFYGIFNLEIAIQIIHPIMIVLPFVLLFTAIVLHIKKNKLAIFYIVAQTLFLTSSLIFGLLFAGILEYSNLTRYIHLVGSFSEIILFSFALGYKTRLVMQENQKQKELVDEYSKFSFLGQTVINIYHQWKSPVNNIYNSINHIETAKEFNDKELDAIIDENLKEIKDNTQYLKETTSSYLNYYKGMDQTKSKFNLKDEIVQILKLHQKEFDKYKININLECNNDLYLILPKNIFTNIIIILIENNINIFKQRNIQSPKIDIKIIKINDNISIKIHDNAGGIVLKNINDIFEKNHSISNSTGLGLFLAKDFLIPKLKGNLEAKNIEDGAMFIITL